MSIVSDWLREVQGLRKRFNGQLDEIRPEYWRLTHALLDEFGAMTTDELEIARSTFADDDADILKGIATTAASSSVVYTDPNRLELGLRALIYAGPNSDSRETLIRLTLLDHSARKLDIQLSDVFEKVRHQATPQHAEFFDNYFLHHSRSIESMGYVEAVDKHGNFTYRQNW